MRPAAEMTLLSVIFLFRIKKVSERPLLRLVYFSCSGKLELSKNMFAKDRAKQYHDSVFLTYVV